MGGLFDQPEPAWFAACGAESRDLRAVERRSVPASREIGREDAAFDQFEPQRIAIGGDTLREVGDGREAA